MRIIVYGFRGWMGRQFRRFLYSHEGDKDIEWIEGQARCHIYQQVHDELTEYKPDRVLSFVGMTRNKQTENIDSMETCDHTVLEQNLTSNLLAPLLLTHVCHELNIHFTYMGTGCLYKESSTPRTEEEPPDFIGSNYSIIKGTTQHLLNGWWKNKLLHLRPRVPILSYPNERNLITKLTTFQKVYDLQENSVSILSDLFPIMIDMIRKKQYGTYNFVNPGTISFREILLMYQTIVDPSFTWNSVSSMDELRKYGLIQGGRSEVKLDTSRLTSLYPTLPPIQESLPHILKEYHQVLNEISPSSDID